MRLPDFLIIGAMKSGTTTLYWDLLTNPRIYMPVDKEVGALMEPNATDPGAIRMYAKHFTAASADHICGEASTGYTKRPTHEGVAERALQVLGPDTKLIYIVREPVSRTISHHYHAFSWGETHGDADRAIREDPIFLDYSRYAYQLEPWIERFGLDHIRVVPFEQYTKDRRATIGDLSRFLGIEPMLDKIRQDVVYNKGENRPIHRGVLTIIKNSSLYRNVLRGFIPVGFRQFLYRTVFPKAPDRPQPPTIDTIDFMIDRLRDDVEKLRVVLGLDEPFWDLDRVRKKYDRETSPPGHDPAGRTPEGITP